MRYFLGYIALVFLGVFIFIFYKNNSSPESMPVVRVFGSTSFIAQWGPGPWLKQEFEKVCNCRVEFIDGADSTILMQRIKSEGSQGADLVLGFDQYDIEMATNAFSWKKINLDGVQFEEVAQRQMGIHHLVPYDWSAMAFVLRMSENTSIPRNLDNLLSSEFAGKISLIDPRTSSVGMQFLMWVINIKGEEQGFNFIKALNAQVQTYGSSWSQAYGMFTRRQVKAAFSYLTSPAYHRIEEKDLDVVAAEFSDGHPLQFEFMGIPENCVQCELGEKFAQFILSHEGQKTIMLKNYMFPVVKGVRDGTVFAQIPNFKMLSNQTIPSISERERLLKRWAQIRRGN